MFRYCFVFFICFINFVKDQYFFCFYFSIVYLVIAFAFFFRLHYVFS